MRKILIFTIVCCQIMLFTSCLTTNQKNLLRDPGGDIPYYPLVPAVGEYTVKPGDELSVRIRSSQESQRILSMFSLFSSAGGGSTRLNTLTVSPEGFIRFPYIGNIHVVGKTTLQIQNDLEQIINKNLIGSNDAPCFVYVRLATRTYSVIGEAGNGRFGISKEQLTIYQAIAQSGDISPYGDRSRVKIIRQTDTGTKIMEFDLRSKDVINSEFYYIQPNDVIYVQPMGRQFWGISSFGTAFSIFFSLLGLGFAVYGIAK